MLRKYIRTEIAVSIFMSCAMNVLMAFVIFGMPGSLPVWGAAGVATDVAPTAFMTALMSAGMPGLLTGRRLRNGALDPLTGRTRLLPGNAFVRAVILAIPSAAVMFALFAAVFAAASIEKLPFAALLAIKIVIGIAVPLVVTPLAVRDALSPADAGKFQP